MEPMDTWDGLGLTRMSDSDAATCDAIREILDDIHPNGLASREEKKKSEANALYEVMGRLIRKGQSKK